MLTIHSLSLSQHKHKPYLLNGYPVTLEEYSKTFPKFDPIEKNTLLTWKKLSNKEYSKLKKEMK